MVSQIAPDVLEGTWEEIASVAPDYNGHRLQLIVLPNTETGTNLPGASATRSSPYADYLKAERAKFADDPPATPEEIAEAEAEVRELLHNLNENRRRESANLFF